MRSSPGPSLLSREKSMAILSNLTKADDKSKSFDESDSRLGLVLGLELGLGFVPMFDFFNSLRTYAHHLKILFVVTILQILFV